jgi:uncharacterized membrane protein
MDHGRDMGTGVEGSGLPDRPHGWRIAADLVAACTFVSLAGLAFVALPAGSWLRVTLALSGLLFAPGYLLVEAVVGPSTLLTARRSLRACIAIGVSPALVGLLALSTAFGPGGFRPGAIVAAVTFACFAFAAIAYARRRRTAGSLAPIASAAAAQPATRLIGVPAPQAVGATHVGPISSRPTAYGGLVPKAP